jgi:hypothetical protein
MESKIGSVGAGFGARPVPRLAERVGRWQQKRVTWAYLGNGVGPEAWRFIGDRKNHYLRGHRLTERRSPELSRNFAQSLLDSYGSERSQRCAHQLRAPARRGRRKKSRPGRAGGPSRCTSPDTPLISIFALRRKGSLILDREPRILVRPAHEDNLSKLRPSGGSPPREHSYDAWWRRFSNT